jgi:CRISPR system Cascade subunit CasA
MNETKSGGSSHGERFNLLDEAWISVIDGDSVARDVSLKEALLRAHEIRTLANELPTLDFAILRLLLAVLHSIFARCDADGKPDAFDDESDPETKALERWKSLWDRNGLPAQPILDYLKEWHERFWLIHDERPFYQVAGLTIGTEYGAAKLIGDISQSNNKPRLFAGRENRSSVSFGEAARWLIYLNAYDDTSSKAKGKTADGGKLPSPGAGYLGKLGMVILEGENLFETLMLNLVLANEKGRPFLPSEPTWEQQERREERINVSRPAGMAELLTIQSRRIKMMVDGDEVTGYRLLGGDFFDTENALIEQMTLWRNDKSARTEVYKPRRHSAEKQFWRDFSALVAEGEGVMPGVLNWNTRLARKKILPQFQARITIAGVAYGDKDFFVDGIISDSISVNIGILAEMDASDGGWRRRIVEVLEQTNNAVIALGKLASDIALAMGDDNEKGRIMEIRKPVRERAYSELDMIFREWLASLRPEQDKDMALIDWRKKARDCIMKLGEEIVNSAPDSAFVGRYCKVGNDREQLYCTPVAWKWFLHGKGGIMKSLPVPKIETENSGKEDNGESDDEKTSKRKAME